MPVFGSLYLNKTEKYFLGGSLCPDGVDFNYQSTRVQLLRTDKALTEILEIDVVKRLWYLLCEDLIYDRHECRW